MYSDVILKSAVYSRDKKCIDQSTNGLFSLWCYPENFEIAASACITLEELFERWPSKHDFIIKSLNERGWLAMAGVQAIYEDKNSYECKPVFQNGLEYLTISEKHPEYFVRYANSFQNFQGEHNIKFFVIPEDYIEQYEITHPEVLRSVELDIEEKILSAPLPGEFREAVEIIRKMPLAAMSYGEQNLCIVELLATAGTPARILYPLLHSRFPDTKNGHNKGVQRLRKSFKELTHKYQNKK